MKKLFTLLIVLLLWAGSSWGQTIPTTLSNIPEKKAKSNAGHYPASPDPLSILQGGDNIATATVISSLPYNDSGTTAGYTNDYNEDCPYTGSTAPDVVYSYAPVSSVTVNIDLCGSSYDTKLFVYENVVTPGAPFACNDDYYYDAACGYYTSFIGGANFIGGNTYYIVIDGYSGFDFGDYILAISEVVPCVWGVDIVCPTGATPESEACGDDANGGCNMDPGTETWEPVPPAGGTICGTTWASDGTRDTDWFELVLTQASSVVLSANADRSIVYGLIEGGTGGYGGNPDCASVTGIFPVGYAGPCDETSIALGTLNPGTYWFFVGLTVFNGLPCPNYYWIDFDIVPEQCPPPLNLTTSNITTNSAVAGWDVPPIEPESFFDVFFGLEGFDPATEGTMISGIPGPPVSFTGLNPSTTYDWYARTDCGFTTPDNDRFWLAIDENSNLLPGLSGGGPLNDPGEDGIWRSYTAPGRDWFNIWFYNDPLDMTRMKVIRMGFWIQTLDPSLPANLWYVVNWSSPSWTGPGYPMPADEAFILRSPTNGPVSVLPPDTEHPFGQWVELSYTIPDFNPEWVSVDIWGTNITILNQLIPPPASSPLFNWWQQYQVPGGIIVHECLPKPNGTGSSLIGPATFTTLDVCPAPINPGTTSITTTSAVLNWDGTVDSFFDITYDLAGFDPDAEGNLITGVGPSPYLLNPPLLPNTSYDWYVREECGFTPDARKDHFWIAINEYSELLSEQSGGTPVDDPGEDGLWYPYTPPEMNWFNIWFYNDPLDLTRMKIIRMGFWVQTFNPLIPTGQLFYVVNWSNQNWNPPDPAFPMPTDEAFIERSPTNGPVDVLPGMQWIELSYIIPDYNPAWISVDIWGTNVTILNQLIAPPTSSPLHNLWLQNPGPGGIIVHECVPKPVGYVSPWTGPVNFSTLMEPLPNPTGCDLALTIPDAGCPNNYLEVPVLVSGAPGTILGTDVLFSSVSIIIDHTWDADLNIYLESPSGISVELSTGNGGSGDDYGDPTNCPTAVTTFTMGAATPVTAGVAPFIGSYIPEGDLAGFHDGTDPNGVWKLKVCDNAPGDIGTVEYIRIELAERPECQIPIELVALSLTSTTADLHWNGGGNIDSFFDISYGPPAYDPDNEGTLIQGIAAPPYTLGNLDPETSYDWYARSICRFSAPDIDRFWIGINESYGLEPTLSGGLSDPDPGEDMIWRQYLTPSGSFWYNIWFYNQPFDDTRMKIIRMGFWVQPLNGQLPGNISYVVNWSTPGWVPPDPPGYGYPMPPDEAFIARSPLNSAPVPVIDPGHPTGFWMELYYVIPDYNPEWVSVDIWGNNLVILQQPIPPPPASPLYNWWQQSPGPGGIIVHECVPKPRGYISPWSAVSSFTTLPTCPAPTALSVGNITNTSADISWTPGGSESSWNVQVGLPGFTPGTNTEILGINGTSMIPWTAAPLQPDSFFDVFVEAVCGFDQPKKENFWIALDEDYQIVPGLSGGAPVDDTGEDGTFYFYQTPENSWHNVWWYNGPVDMNRMKIIRMGFWVQPFIPGVPGTITYVVNWSTPNWVTPPPPAPGFPMPPDEAFIVRSPINGPVQVLPTDPEHPNGQWVELYYVIPDFNPEWVSFDIWGQNVQIVYELIPPPMESPLYSWWMQDPQRGGILLHECLPKPVGNTSTWSGPVTFSTTCNPGQPPICESFFDVFFPVCWTEQYSGLITSSHWSVVNSSFAGGVANEARAHWSPGQGATQADNDRLVSPPINTTGLSALHLSFRQMLDDYAFGDPDVWIKVQSSSDCVNWTDEWVYGGGGGGGGSIPAEVKTIEITNNLGGTTWIAWTLSGNTFDINDWYVDDICISHTCIWNGMTIEWDNPYNWSCGTVPGPNTNVIIPSAPSGGHFPVIMAPFDVEILSMDIQGGAIVTVQDGATLNVLHHNP